MKRQKTNASNCLVNMVKESSQKQRDLLLLRALISTNTSFTFCEDPYVSDFLRSLSTTYSPPSKFKLINSVMNEEYAECREELQTIVENEINTSNFLTLMLDGWSDIKRRSIYGILLCNPRISPIVIDCKNSSSKESTGVNLSKLVVSSCEKWVRNFEGVDAVVTDNASNMSLMKSLLQEETRLPDTDGNDEGSFRMIILPGLSHSLKLFCKTRWYSAVQTLRSVVDHESIFRAVTHPDSPGPHIPQHIDDIISDRKFFLSG